MALDVTSGSLGNSQQLTVCWWWMLWSYACSTFNHWVYRADPEGFVFWNGMETFPKFCGLGRLRFVRSKGWFDTLNVASLDDVIIKILHLWEIWHIWHASLHFDRRLECLFNLGCGCLRHLLPNASLRNEKRHMNHSWQLRYNSFGVEWMYLHGEMFHTAGKRARCLYSAYEHHADVYGLQS